MGLSRQLVIFGIVIGGYQLIQSRSRGKDLEEYYNLKYGAESAGQKVRNRLQGADVGPQDEMLEDPSIYRDWAMVQKGYQSLRMMNDNDNFNSEEWHIKTGDEGDDCQECGNDLEGALGYDWVKSERLGGMGHLLCSTCHLQAGGNFKNAESFSSEWHYFSECETKGCDGDIEYRDVYACPSCGQDDVEILLGDTCPDCGETAEDVSKYAIFYCSDCEEDYTDMYNSEGFGAETAYSMIKYQDDDCLQQIADSLRPKYNLAFNEGELFWDFDMDTGDMMLYIYDGDNKKLDEITYDRKALTKALKEQGYKNPESWGAETYSGKKLNDKIDAGDLTHIYPGDYNNPTLTYYLQLTDAEFKATYPVLACQYCGRDTKMVEVSPDGYELTYKCDPVCMPVFKSAESFSAHVYRGKPMSELGYAGRAMATQKMIKAADIEHSILQLEAAIKVGLISEDEIMDQLRKKFSE